MDLLSDVLLSLKLRSTIISNWQLSEPWGFETKSFPAGYCFNIVAGELWFSAPDSEPELLLAGDSVLVPIGGEFNFYSSDNAPIAPLHALWKGDNFAGFDHYLPSELHQIDWGGGGAKTTLLSFAFEFQPNVQLDLLKALPSAIILRQYQGTEFPSFQSAIAFLSQDASNKQPGFVAIAAQLVELIIIGQLRSYILSETKHPKGWLPGLLDKKIGKALAAIHRHPEKQWSVTRLAVHAGMSRSSFAQRFQQLVGVGPITYLSHWRIQLAAELLQTTKHSISDITEMVGWTSDRSFRRLFNQRMGKSPLAFRRDTKQ
ncbi:cupin domain-containing protein [Marinomonas posidonica]|uniref:AraC family transcriptional regulator n=1 Tax=Marinomonas posidonica TaxID=936476 RepID=UPI003735A735